MSDATVVFTIDGKEVRAQANQTIMEAADTAGIYIPRLCFHPDLPPGGHCRVCTVKANGRPVSSCTFPVSDGLIVENDNEEIAGLRRDIIEMLFAEGRHFCPSCEESGDCELQATAYRLGLAAPTTPALEKVFTLDASHPDVYLDSERCILCGRCVRASRVLDKKSVFGFAERGAEMHVAVDGPGGLATTALSASDRAARICPTGCLKIKREGYDTPVGARKFDHEPIGTEIDSRRGK